MATAYHWKLALTIWFQAVEETALKEVGASPFQLEVPEVEVEGSGLATVGPSCDI